MPTHDAPPFTVIVRSEYNPGVIWMSGRTRPGHSGTSKVPLPRGEVLVLVEMAYISLVTGYALAWMRIAETMVGAWKVSLSHPAYVPEPHLNAEVSVDGPAWRVAAVDGVAGGQQRFQPGRRFR